MFQDLYLHIGGYALGEDDSRNSRRGVAKCFASKPDTHRKTRYTDVLVIE